MCRSALVEARVCRRNTKSMELWGGIIYDFAEANANSGLTTDKIVSKFLDDVVAKYKRKRKRAARMKKAKRAINTSRK